jgi:hypothetical protein
MGLWSSTQDPSQEQRLPANSGQVPNFPVSVPMRVKRSFFTQSHSPSQDAHTQGLFCTEVQEPWWAEGAVQNASATSQLSFSPLNPASFSSFSQMSSPQILPICYGVNVCPKFMCGKSVLQIHYVDRIWRWVLWEVIGMRWGHEGETPMMALGDFWEKAERFKLSLCCHEISSTMLQGSKEALAKCQANTNTRLLDSQPQTMN